MSANLNDTTPEKMSLTERIGVFLFVSGMIMIGAVVLYKMMPEVSYVWVILSFGGIIWAYLAIIRGFGKKLPAAEPCEVQKLYDRVESLESSIELLRQEIAELKKDA